MSAPKGGSLLRATATRVIHQVAHEGQSLGQLLPPSRQRCPAMNAADSRTGVLAVAAGGTGCRPNCRCACESPLPRRNALLESLLILGLYQLRFTRIAPRGHSRNRGNGQRARRPASLTGLVNGILRNALRDGEPPIESEAVHYSHPEWLVAKLKANWPEYWQTLLEANNCKPPMTLRFNRQQHNQQSAQSALADAGITASPGELAPNAIRLAEPCPVERIPGFSDGYFSVQDEAAQLCTELLELEPGQRVLDACAAPGGKTGAILEAEPGLSEVVAMDMERDRLGLITENLERIGAHARLIAADAGDTQSWWDGTAFDRILLDAPCSGTGVIRRHPDIKLLRRETDITELAATQLRVLEGCWETLRNGGRLVYATCSVLQQENKRIIQRFINSHMDAQLVPITLDWGEETGYGRQLITGSQDQDGFFYACLVKSPAHWV